MDFKYGIYDGAQNGKIILTEKSICAEHSISGETDGSDFSFSFKQVE